MERSGAEMKKLLVLLVVILAVPSLTAYAASSTSRRFVVRNWKAPITLDSTTPDSTDEVETEEPGKPEEPTTPAPTDEVEPEEPEEQGDEPEEQGEEPLADDEPLPADDEQAIPPVDENEDGQGETNEPDADELPSPDPSIDEVEQSEELTAVEMPAAEGEEEITINTEEEPVEPIEPEEVGEARVVIGGSGRRRRAREGGEADRKGLEATVAEPQSKQSNKNQLMPFRCFPPSAQETMSRRRKGRSRPQAVKNGARGLC